MVEWSGTLCDGGMGQETHEWEEVGVEAGVRIPDRSSRRDRSVPGQTLQPLPTLLSLVLPCCTNADAPSVTAIPSHHPGVSTLRHHTQQPLIFLASLFSARPASLDSLAHRRLKHYQPSILLWAGGIGAGVALFAQAIPIFKVRLPPPSFFPLLYQSLIRVRVAQKDILKRVPIVNAYYEGTFLPLPHLMWC